MTGTGHEGHLKQVAVLVPLAAAVAALLACGDPSTGPPRAPSPTSAAARGERDGSSTAVATLAWEETARALVVSHALSPLAAGRLYALHSVAAYAAVVAVGRGGDDAEDSGGRARYEARRGAIGGASVQLLSFLLPDAATALETQLASDGQGADGRTHPQFTRGVSVGRASGDAMIARAKTDGFALPWSESMRNAPGVGIWTGVAGVPPFGFQFPTMTPYFLTAMNGHTAQSQFRPPPPPAYSLVSGSPFQIALAEVRDISLHRTQQQIDIANFWNLGLGSVAPLGYWDEQAAQFVAEHHLGERAASHLFALVNAATMDAAIGCWEAKFTYFMLRPTMADPTIITVYPVPNHPSYPSGHSCVSSAAVTVISRYFPEHAEALNAQLVEAGLSRIYGGIHYRFDIDAGRVLGRSTAEWAMAYDRDHGLLTAVGLGAHEEDELGGR